MARRLALAAVLLALAGGLSACDKCGNWGIRTGACSAPAPGR